MPKMGCDNCQHCKNCRKRKKKEKTTDTHHFIPRSRGGIDAPWNRKTVSIEIHRAWHIIFQNLTPAEVKDLIKMWHHSVDSTKFNEAIKRHNGNFDLIFKGERTLKGMLRIIDGEWYHKI